MDSSNIQKYIDATINELVPGFNICNGYFLGYRYNAEKDRIDNFEVRDSDVWVCSYPKTGTTWTQEMVWLLVNGLDYESAKSPLNNRFPCVEMELMFDFTSLKDIREPEYLDSFEKSIEFTNGIKANPRCVKTHLPWDLLPKSIQSKEKRPKIIFVMRNPKDTCVSYYHHCKLLNGYNGSIEDFATLFLHDKVFWSPYWDCLNSYWQQKDDPNVLIIKFEDMKKNLRSIVMQVADFLGKSLSDEEIDKLLDHLSFKSMRNNRHTNYIPLDAKNDEEQFIRKGIVGDFKNAMTPELIAKFDTWIAEKNTMGLTF